ncbi:SET domain-containing protein [uncultured Enterovirga sp.]|uniref:SET domain-containing protein n=1 Tax=uncultured Enterovirga sp. TaxID=2026352 RepID=UPI0035CB4E74
MLLVPTRVAPSPIQGLGLFADVDLPEGAEIWRFAEGFDLLLRPETFSALPDAFRTFLDTYGYTPQAFPGRIVLSCDHAKFMNHAEDPNTVGRDLSSFARRPIRLGEELTCDYREVCAGWPGFS